MPDGTPQSRRAIERALVVGGAGFFGSWIVRTLAEEGVHAVVVDRSPRAVPGAAEVVRADVLTDDAARVLRDAAPDVLFHLANTAAVGPSVDAPAGDLRANVLTTIAVLEAARAATPPPTVLYVSSAAVYGDAGRLPVAEDHPVRPVSPYGASKAAAEAYVDLYARLHGVPGISVRPFSLYGPGQRKLAVYELLARVLRGDDPLEVLGVPDATRDLVYVEDGARACLTLARRAPAEGEAYNLASGAPVAVEDLVAALLRAAGRSPAVRFSGRVRPGDPLRMEGDPSRAAALGVECRTALEDGLRATAEWVASDLEGASR